MQTWGKVIQPTQLRLRSTTEERATVPLHTQIQQPLNHNSFPLKEIEDEEMDFTLLRYNDSDARC